jgi:uncharacterized membrane protein YkgB
LANDAAVLDNSIATRALTFLSSLGGLKFATYEADSIVPLVAHSPIASFLYHHPAPEYRPHMNKEGELKPANKHPNKDGFHGKRPDDTCSFLAIKSCRFRV